MMAKRQPLRVFVGSSAKAKRTTELLARWLRGLKIDSIVWFEHEIFQPPDPSVQDWTKIARSFDGAAFIFSEDESFAAEGMPKFQTKDNLHIEFGLFLGVMTSNRAIVCRNGAKRPSDLPNVTYFDLADQRRAREQIALWAQLLLKAKDPAEGESRHNIATAVNVLEDRTTAAAGGNVRIGADPLSARVASNTFEILEQSETSVNLAESRTEIRIDQAGDADVTMSFTFEGTANSLPVYPFSISGDIPASLGDVRIRISSEGNGRCWSTVSGDTSKKKNILILFDPPIRRGERRKVKLDWHWPRVFANLTRKKIDYWDHLVASASAVKKIEIILCVDKSILPLQLSSNLRKGRITVSELIKKDRKANSIYRWIVEDFVGSKFSLKLHPKPKKRTIMPK